MGLKWIDVQEIVIALDEKYPELDPLRVNFPDLMQMVLELDGFDDDPSHCGEKILEAIQMTWIDEKD